MGMGRYQWSLPRAPNGLGPPLPRTMCWDPICTVAEVWCCSENHCGVLTEVSWWRHSLQCIVTMQSFLRFLKQHKLVVCKLDLSGGSYSVSRCVRPWIKLTPEYPFKVQTALTIFLLHVAWKTCCSLYDYCVLLRGTGTIFYRQNTFIYQFVSHS